MATQGENTPSNMSTTTTSAPHSAIMQKSPPLSPLITTTNPQRRPSAQRQPSLLSRRVSSYSTSRSIPPCSRPVSVVFPAFHSSLPYTLVRDFAYPWSHPTHYGPQPEDSVQTPASESRRLSDPSLSHWDDSRGQWSATPAWMTENSWPSRDRLPAMTFNDGGPPYSEDEDLQSPIVTSSRHKKHKSERGRPPGVAGTERTVLDRTAEGRVEEYHPIEGDELDGPGGEIESYTTSSYMPKHRDSNFAKPLQRNQSPYDDSFGRTSEEENSEDETRLSRDYSFTIASPDEEMHGKAVALFDFESEHENELPLREGQIILVSYRHGQGWLVAENPRTGESGLVPEEFVRLLRHIEGGLNSLQGIEDGETNSPVSNDAGSAVTPTPPNDGFERQPAIQSKFSTHTKDFSPIRKSSKADETPKVPQR